MKVIPITRMKTEVSRETLFTICQQAMTLLLSKVVNKVDKVVKMHR